MKNLQGDKLREYIIYGQMSGICPENTYPQIHTTNSFVIAIIMLIVFRFKYPQAVLTISGKYIECEDCPYDCGRKDKEE